MKRQVLILVGAMLATAALAKEWPSKVPPRAEHGKQIYETYCLSCHGAQAKGDGPATAALVAKVPDFSMGFGDAQTDELTRNIMRGTGKMPAFELSFTRDEADIVLDYMATLGRKATAPVEEVEEQGEEDEGEAEAEAPAE
jgi:mono/diheme cytochrome c family protein